MDTTIVSKVVKAMIQDAILNHYPRIDVFFSTSDLESLGFSKTEVLKFMYVVQNLNQKHNIDTSGYTYDRGDEYYDYSDFGVYIFEDGCENIIFREFIENL